MINLPLKWKPPTTWELILEGRRLVALETCWHLENNYSTQLPSHGGEMRLIGLKGGVWFTQFSSRMNNVPRQTNSSTPGLVQDFRENILPQVMLLAEIHDSFAQALIALVHGTLEQPWLQVLASTCNCILQMLLLSKANSNRIILVVACLMAFQKTRHFMIGWPSTWSMVTLMPPSGSLGQNQVNPKIKELNRSNNLHNNTTKQNSKKLEKNLCVSWVNFSPSIQCLFLCVCFIGLVEFVLLATIGNSSLLVNSMV